jgi:DNA-binding NtrC family response regulator
LQQQCYPVGLLVDPVAPDQAGALSQFLQNHWQTHWIGVFDPANLALPACRDLIADHLFDFHTWPVEPALLAHTLGHAHGCARLRLDRLQANGHNLLPSLTGDSPAIVRLRAQICRVAQVDAPVLICGESGSGKELTAQAIHARSRHSNGPFVAINCGAMPANLIQSELFGYERGAFTGATKDKAGLIESAQNGTIFLDEIADLPKELQANLLRFLQERTIYRIGATRAITVNARVIAASHVNLQQAVNEKLFREDLFYRLNVLPLHVPPLRARKEDLVRLAEDFFCTYAADRAPQLRGFSRDALQAILQHSWPGNVRELINRIRRAMVLAEGKSITAADLGLGAPPISVPRQKLGLSRDEAEKQAICASLAKAGSNVSKAARELGISRMTLYRLLSKHGIST